MEGPLTLRSNRQFYALLLAWAVFALLLPFGIGAYTSTLSLSTGADGAGRAALSSALSWVQVVSLALGTGLFVYTAARTGWRRMWLFPVVQLSVAALIDSIYFPLLYGAAKRAGSAYAGFSAPSVQSLLISMLTAFLTLCVRIVLVRLCAARLKREWQIVLLAFVLLAAFGYIAAAAGSFVYVLAASRFYPGQTPWQDVDFARILARPWGYVRLNLEGAAGYLVVALVLMEHKRKKFGRAGAAVKKLWDATAK